MIFKSPWVLFFIPAVVFGIFLAARQSLPPAFRFSSEDIVAGLPRSWRVRVDRLPLVLRLGTIVLFMVALAGPRSPLGNTPLNKEGVTIILALDLSTSMAAEDFTLDGKRTNRLDVIKNVVKDFVKQRSNDRVGLIAFAARPYMVCPPTLDHAWLLSNLDRLRFGVVEDGTAIGSAILSAVNRLKDMEGKSRTLVLLTDGVNNAGSVDPLTAARAAEAKGIRIYTIGAGSRDLVPYPVTDLFGRTVYQNIHIDIDEDMLKEAARVTGGAYFRATDTASLKNIYAEIDRLEKVTFKEKGYQAYEERFVPFLIAGLLLLVAEAFLSRTIFLKIP